jgi:drug/metabolite transporter (DMT)-like permease
MQSFRAGLALLLGFVAAQAVRDVYLRHLFGNLGLFDVALVAFGTVAGVFGLGLLLFGRHQIRLLCVVWREVIAVNVTTVVAWLSYFGALRLVEPAGVNLAFSGVAPAAVALWSFLGLRSGADRRPGRFESALHWTLLGIVVAVAGIVSSGRSGFATLDPATGLAGVALAAFSGIVIAGETIISKRMNEVGVSALSIVSIRFSLVTTVAALMVARAPGDLSRLSAGAVAEQSLIFLVILVGPIYMGQVGLKFTSPLLSNVISALGPITTLALQSTVGVVPLSSAMLIATTLYALVAIAAAVAGAVRFGAPAGEPVRDVLSRR